MFKLLLLVVLANCFFDSLQIYVSESNEDDSNEYFVGPKNYYYQDSDSESEENDEIDNNESDYYPDGCSNNYPGGCSNNYPEGYSNNYPEEYSNNYPEGYSNNYPDGYSNQCPAGYSNNYPGGDLNNYPACSNNYPRGDSDNYPEGCSNNYPGGCSNNYPGECSNNYPEGCSNNYPGECSNNYPEGCSNNYPGGCSNNYPEGCSNNYPGGCSNNYPGGCSNNYPEGDTNNYPGGCPNINYGDKQCANALQLFNEGIFRSGLPLFQGFVESAKYPGALSPLGTLLTLAALAVYGIKDTRAEVFPFINLSNRRQVECAFGRINSALLNLPKDVIFYGASDYFGNCPFEFTPGFVNFVRCVVVGKAINLDFSQSKQAGDYVNGVIETDTCGKVQNIVEDYSIFNRSTELVRLVGSYFSSPWEIEFELSKQVTQFNVAPGRCVPASFYTQVAVYEYAYSSELKSQAIRIYYKDRKFNLLVILPDEPFTQNLVLNRMLESPAGWYARLCQKLKLTKANVTISAYNQVTREDTRSLLIERSNLRTIYSGETIQLKGAIKGDIPAGVSAAFQENFLQIPSTGGPVKYLPKGKAVDFVANYPHFFFMFITETNTPLYFGYTNGPTTGECLKLGR